MAYHWIVRIVKEVVVGPEFDDPASRVQVTKSREEIGEIENDHCY